jgi:hypothetical protein
MLGAAGLEAATGHYKPLISKQFEKLELSLYGILVHCSNRPLTERESIPNIEIVRCNKFNPQPE